MKYPAEVRLSIKKDRWTWRVLDEEGKVMAKHTMYRTGAGEFRGPGKDKSLDHQLKRFPELLEAIEDVSNEMGISNVLYMDD